MFLGVGDFYFVVFVPGDWEAAHGGHGGRGREGGGGRGERFKIGSGRAGGGVEMGSLRVIF